MSRTLSQIYAEAVATRNNYLQLTELDSASLSNSKLSIMNLMTYVMAMMIYSYETILDVFQMDIVSLLSSRIGGTGPWYVAMSKLFQYNSANNTMDEMQVNESSFRPEFVTYNENHQIIAKAAYQITDDKEDADIVLKVCKNADGTNNSNISGTTLTKLSDNELTAFKTYMESVKYIGTTISYISCPGDILTLKATVYYDDRYLTAEQAFSNVQTALTEYTQSLEYNDYLCFQKLIDTIQNVQYITDIDSNATAKLLQYDVANGAYRSEHTAVTNRIRPISGYITFMNESNASTLNTTNLVFKPSSILS